MAKKFFVASQAPFVEIPVTSEKDVTGSSQTIIIGFKRYGLKVAQAKLDSFKDLSDDQAQNLLKSEILYIKNASVTVYDDETLEKVETINVKDTRTVQPYEPFWADKDECLSVLVDHYLDSIPWKGSIITSFIQSLYNIDFKEAEAKNS